MIVVYLETPEDVVRQRMMGRGRVDDTEEKITERLRWSMDMMHTMLEYYKTRPNTEIITVDGAESIDEVQTAIREGLSI